MSMPYKGRYGVIIECDVGEVLINFIAGAGVLSCAGCALTSAK